MKKNYLLLSATLVFSFTSVFAQNQNANQQENGIANPKVKTENRLKNSNINPTILQLPAKEEGKNSGFGNHTCKSHELTEKHYQERGELDAFNKSYLKSTANSSVPATMKTPGINTISIIFHVVHNPNNPAENVSNAKIMQVFNDIQEDFQLLNSNASNARSSYGFVPADANINFCLATQTPTGTPLTEVGVVRVSTTEDWFDSNNGEENKMKASSTGGSQIWDRNKYLNVWICDISNGASSGTAGYAYRPTTSYLPTASIDGVVLDYNLGVNNFNVLTHEIGHYLGLDHTWGGSGSCSNDDGFTDTPNTAGPSFNYPGSCSGNQSTCSGVQTQYENYMDYSNCTVMFTQKQADYMLSVLSGIRNSLLLSPGCDPVNAPPVANFIADIGSPIRIPVGGTVNFTDQSTNNPTSWSWNFGGGAANQTVRNPTVVFNTVGIYNISLTATNSYGNDSEVKNGFVEVVTAASGTQCDTLRNYNRLTESYASYSLIAPSKGYIPGTAILGGTINVTKYADKYNAPTSTQVRRLILPIFKAHNGSGNGMLKIRIVNDNAGSPGTTVAALDTLRIADMVAQQFNTFDFTNPATVTGNFWVEFEFFYPTPLDTIVLGMVNIAQRGSNPNTMKLFYNGTWNTVANTFGAGNNSSLYLDVLTSNGAAPNADFSFSEAEICAGGQINVNGALSTNTTNYDWYLTNSTGSSVISNSTTPSNTYTFPNAGNYRIYLFAEGSCKTDGLYLPIVVNSIPSATVSATQPTCDNNNGRITITAPTGGDSPNYSYSLDGVNYQTSTTFNNLPSGSYTVRVKTPGNKCERTYPVTLNPSTAFTAGISPNVSICPSESTTLSATGGNNYTWYDGSTNIGTGATLTVSPNTTTQYSCVVVNGSGCTSTVYTTVNVSSSGCLSIEELTNENNIYPNPTNGLVNIETKGEFSFELNDSRGRLVLSGKANNAIQLDMNGYMNGIYLLYIKTENTSTLSRIIKQ